MRIHNDPVDVQLVGAQPAQFRWRNQLWRVHQVQRHWVEAGAWWHDPSVLTGGGDLLGERQLWLVEAVGPAAQTGVYELSCHGTDGWRLRAVID